MAQDHRAPPPLAAWVSDEARAYFARELAEAVAPPGDIEGLRAFYGKFNEDRLAVARTLYPVTETARTIAGVAVDLVQPKDRQAGAPRPALICLHGGGFMWGAGAGALLEAVPVAAVSGLDVIAVDYRLAPEHRFPAAVDDVVAVYRALLKDETVSSIGIFGCSAGAALTAQTVARLMADGDPLPGAISMLHAAGVNLGGDSAATTGLLTGTPEQPAPDFETMPYFIGADPKDPLVMPGEHPDVLSRFPPSLLISATRDFAASSCTVMHRRLLAAGAEAELVIFDGLWHAHHMATDLPESRETFDLISRFFHRHLK